MSIKNIAIVFAPNIFRIANPNDDQDIIMQEYYNIKIMNNIFKTILEAEFCKKGIIFDDEEQEEEEE